MTDERRAAIVALLESMNEGLPLPVRRDHTPRGFVSGVDSKGRPLRWLTCEDCLTNGKPMAGCETCGGQGRIPDLGKDPYMVDKTQPYGLTPARHERTRERDAELDRLASQTREPFKTPADELADANAHPYRWERERVQLRKRYDLEPLVAALDVLHERDDGAYHALHAMYVYGWAEPSVVYETACERGLRFLDVRLPDPLRSPGVEKHPAQAKWEAKHAA